MDKNKRLAEITNEIRGAQQQGVGMDAVDAFVTNLTKNLIEHVTINKINLNNKYTALQSEYKKLQEEIAAEAVAAQEAAKTTETKTEEVVATPTPRNKKH